ncbi:hypothetical protein WCE37_01150 [Luteimonas sp. MJ250]|uniref:hypothetical protein n=1 Tax=Luteimonas sp. MJ250 TaxID=3129236 RepID=UPI0031BB3F89
MNRDAILKTVDEAARILYVRAESPADEKLAQALLDVHGELKGQQDAPEAITTLESEQQWAESPLPLGVANRLKAVDNCLDAIGTIADMLLKDALGKADKRGSGAAFEGLSTCEVWGLRVALQELHRRAEQHLGEVADPSDGCHDTRPANRREREVTA